jgi:hypothetical protein
VTARAVARTAAAKVGMAEGVAVGARGGVARAEEVAVRMATNASSRLKAVVEVEVEALAAAGHQAKVHASEAVGGAGIERRLRSLRATPWRWRHILAHMHIHDKGQLSRAARHDGRHRHRARPSPGPPPAPRPSPAASARPPPRPTGHRHSRAERTSTLRLTVTEPPSDETREADRSSEYGIYVLSRTTVDARKR